ncbi:MAG: hypothetical protein ABL994_16870, partial [Verrucomicrobiales bacterium]
RAQGLTVGLSKQGPAGPPGAGVEVESYVAAAHIGGHRAVALNSSGQIILATASGEIPAIGMIRDAVISGASVTVYRSAKVGGFSGLTPGATYYLSDIGAAVLTPPAGGVLQVLGVAGSATELLLDPGEPVAI